MRMGRVLSEKLKNAPIDFVKDAMVCGNCARTIHFDRPGYSVMAQPFNHWQANIFRD
jgi:hypothetical protein